MTSTALSAGIKMVERGDPETKNSRLKMISLYLRSSCLVSGNLLHANYLCLGKAVWSYHLHSI